ncbi:hypothetical protein V8E53_004125 [Lactarius tabidus]
MDSSKANSREYQRQAIDAEIKSLEESVQESFRALRRRRNALAPISSLPTEVIAAIFSILRLVDRRRTHHDLAWLRHLRVTHVCHQWREIALNNPLFWNHIDFTKLSLTGAAEMLVRAKKAPLHLEARIIGYEYGQQYTQNRARFNAFIKELQPRVTNICRLEITAHASFFRRALKGLTSPAPTLESLSLSTRTIDCVRSPSRASIPDTLFGGMAPRLSFLELYKCNISWKSPLLKGLRSLDIHRPSKHRPSLADWLNALDEMPQLKKLILHSASPIAPPFPVNIERNVTLPFLQCLGISASAGECALALSHLVLPVLTELYINAKSVLLGGGDVLNLLPYVARHSHGPQDTQPLQNVTICGERKHLEIFAYPDTNAQVYYTVPRVELSVRCLCTNKILGPAMTALPLVNLLKLTALYSTQLDEVFWHTHGLQWPLLESVTLPPPAARGFREMILQDNSGHENPPFPSLTNLALHDEGTFTVPRALRLRDALMKRVDQGVPLETLEICSFFASCIDHSVVVEILSEIVAHVSAYKELDTGSPDQDSGAEDRYYESDPHSSDDDEEEGGDEIDDEEDEEDDYGATE